MPFLIQAGGGAVKEMGNKINYQLVIQFGGVFDLGGGTAVVQQDFEQSGGIATLGNGGTMTVLDTVILSGGTFTLTNSTLSATNGVQIQAGGDLSGYGSIVATLTNSGTIDVGGANYTGTLSITGDYNNNSTGVVNMEASASGVNDQLQVSGSVYLTGTLNFSLLGGYHPASGDHFSLLTFGGTLTYGGFTVNYPPLDPGLGWWLTTSPPGTLGLTVVPHS